MNPEQRTKDTSSASLVNVERLLNPRSVAIVGVSPKPGSPGIAVLNNLISFQYDGEIYLVSRNSTEVKGITCYREIDHLPEGIDTVVLCVPQPAVLEAVEACARRKAGSVIIFAAGFAEAGEEGKKIQQRMTQLARQHGMAIAGPNCIGLMNFVDEAPLTFVPNVLQTTVEDKPALAVLSQSGGMMSNIRGSAQARDIPVSYAISTGNEAVVGIEDHLAFLIDDPYTKVITMFVEHIRRPKLFLDLAAKAREKGKYIVMLHPGKSEASREAAKSHTGSLAGEYTIIKTFLEDEHVVVVDTLEELLDTSYLLTLFDNLPNKGLGIVTDSGAFKGYALDYCETVGLKLPNPNAGTIEALQKVIPPYAEASNPLDITAQALIEMNLYADTAEALLQDESIGSLLVSVLPASPEVGLEKGRSMLPVIKGSKKPVVFLMLGEGIPMSDELIEELKDHDIPLFRSAERAMKALSILTDYGNRMKERKQTTHLPHVESVTLSGTGVLNEYTGKQFLQDIGIAVPQGILATTIEEAITGATNIGYPVVLKAQSGQLAHKSDVGGVIVGVNDEEELRESWERLHDNISSARPGLKLDGVLVEKMAEKGIEMVVGGRRDPQWGPVIMVGLGGIWIEILKDVCFLPPDQSEDEIIEKILTLRSAPLLQGARGEQPSDLEAVAKVVSQIGQVMLSKPELIEIDINPLVVYPDGQGAVALDALIVTKEG